MDKSSAPCSGVALSQGDKHVTPVVWRPRATKRALVLWALAGALGCGGKGTVPFEPVFLLDGAPLADASVSFVRFAGENGRAAFGVTDATGKASLTTFEPNDGVPPGAYQVVVIKAPDNPMSYEVANHDLSDRDALIQLSTMKAAGDAMGGPARRGSPRRIRSVIPERYSDPGTTPLSCEVSAGTRELTFELTSAK